MMEHTVVLRRLLWVMWSMASLTGCAERVAGIQVALWASIDPAMVDAEGVLRLKDGAGHVIRLERAAWVVRALELVRCREDAGASAVLGRWLLPVARAHGQSSPTRMAVPHVVSATSRTAVALGGIEPAVGSYCEVRVTLGPADADAVGLEGNEPMVGRSLWLRGLWSDEAGGVHPFEVTGGAERLIALPVGVEPLRLDASHRRAAIWLQADPGAWFGAVDLSNASRADRSRAIFAALGSSLSLQVR